MPATDAGEMSGINSSRTRPHSPEENHEKPMDAGRESLRLHNFHLGYQEDQSCFGQSSIFLLGGQKRDQAPVAMFMHSGDVMIMSGFSRLLYHAVPRVLPNLEGKPLPSCMEQPLPPDLPADSVVQPCSQDDWEVCAKYLQASRINMTVRQVLAEGQTFPAENMTEGEPHAFSVGSYHEEHTEIKRHKCNTDS